MTYQWKLPGIVPVDAQTAGDELSRIYEQNGALEPSAVVNESRPTMAPLHPCFEWDDAVAAEKYREHQAGGIIRNITVVSEDDGTREPVRAFVHVQNVYQPLSIVLSDEEKTEELLRTALNELKAFRAKYDTLSKLAPVMDAIDAVQTA